MTGLGAPGGSTEGGEEEFEELRFNWESQFVKFSLEVGDLLPGLVQRSPKLTALRTKGHRDRGRLPHV